MTKAESYHMERVPGESEYGLLVWVNEDLARETA